MLLNQMQFEEGNIYFNKIIVIESIPDSERQTGTEIYNDILDRHSWMDPNLSVKLISVNNKKDFFYLLNTIKNDVINKEYIPFLHIETHGTVNGIKTKSGEYVDYIDFINIIREINVLTKNNLFLSISACWGGRIQFLTDIRKPCPFRGFIGPMESIYPNDLISSFSIFFNELLLSNDFGTAINLLNTNNQTGIEFHHYNAEAFWKVAIEAQKNNLLKSEDSRERYIINESRIRWKNDPRVRVKFRSRSKFRDFLRGISVEIIPKSYQAIRERFLHQKT